ncbi:hypothetical protein MTR_5g037970 [Medicago truncatula]|uniref:Uncharacterized protein n=1 Tax=Medicago truncatula TaxID=3880 RepID=G7K9N8_MEDTR|nr:hypothetical protein MTR_5g037970 [Medicago truncatula]
MNLINKCLCVLFLYSNSSVLALIDELGKLHKSISSALVEELELATQTKNESRESETLAENSEPRPSGENSNVVEDILNLLYFGSLFEVKTQNDFTSTMLTMTRERGLLISRLTESSISKKMRLGDALNHEHL